MTWETTFRPRLTPQELAFIIKSLEETIEASDMGKSLCEEKLHSTSLHIDDREKLKNQAFTHNRRKLIAEGIIQRFQDLLDGKKRGRIKHNSILAQMAANSYLKEGGKGFSDWWKEE